MPLAKYQTAPITCYHYQIVTKNNNNSQFADHDLEPTLELEPLSEEDCARLMLAEESLEQSEADSEIEETQRNYVGADAPMSQDDLSDIQELRDALKFRDEMNGILQLGIDQQREKCGRLTEQVSDLQESNKELSRELERSRKQLQKSKKKLAKAQETEQALLINLKKLNRSDSSNRVIADQGDAIAELQSNNQKLTETISSLEEELERARQETTLVEARLSDAANDNERLSVTLRSESNHIDDNDVQLAASQRTSADVAQKTPEMESKEGRAPAEQIEGRWMLVSQNDGLPESHVLSNGVVVIGNSRDCDIQIQSQFISRHHAQLVNTNKGCVLGDLNSTNGTFVNSRRINKRVLRAGDLVTIGKHRFRFEERSGTSNMYEERD